MTQTLTFDFTPRNISDETRNEVNELLNKEFPAIIDINFVNIDPYKNLILATTLIAGETSNSVFPTTAEFIKKVITILEGEK